MRRIALFAVSFAFLAALVAVSPGPAAGAAKAKLESYQAFLAQLSKGEVKSAVLVPKRTIVRARLKTGARYRAKYPTAERKRLVSLLHQRNVHVSFAKPKKKKHHSTRIRRRYIALAVVGLGVIASAGWIFTRRRRTEE